MGTCLYCSNQTAAGCQMCNPNESHETWLQKTITIDNPYQEQLDRIEEKINWLVDNMLAKKKPKPRAAKKQEYSSEFECAWAEYPRRSGANPKVKAYASWNARLKEAMNDAETADEMFFATVEYCKYCDAAIEDKRYVMQGATFYGCNLFYKSDWTIPKQKEKNGQPEIFSQSHQDADFSGQAEKALDPVDPYAELKS